MEVKEAIKFCEEIIDCAGEPFDSYIINTYALEEVIKLLQELETLKEIRDEL